MKKISRGYRKYLRAEKARIRREVIDQKEQKKLIDELYSSFEEKEQIKE